MSSTCGLAVEACPRLEADGHTVLSCQVDDLLEIAVGSSLNNEDAFDRSRLGLKAFKNGVDAEDDLHQRSRGMRSVAWSAVHVLSRRVRVGAGL